MAPSDNSDGAEGPGSTRVISTVVAVSVVGVIPAHLVGTLAVFLREDLDFDQAGLGLAVAVRAIGAAALAWPLGRLAQRLGPERSLRVAALAAAASGFGLGLLVHSYYALLVALAAAGLVHALSQPAADLWLVRAVPIHKRGLAYGVKQASVPAASLLAGLAVPVIAVTLGWRWAFAGAGAVALVVAFTMPRSRIGPVTPAPRSGGVDAPLGAMAILVLGMVLASMPVNAFQGFLVSAQVEAGTSASVAGTMFAVGALAGLIVRVVLGRVADRSGRPQLPIVVAMLTAGAFGYALIATMNATVMMISTPIIFTMSWGWPGLFFLALGRANPNATASATGMINMGAFAGAAIGPIGFGLVARSSYTLAWLLAAGCAFAAALVIQLASHRLRE